MAFPWSLDEPAQVLITGASRGIGAALVEQLLAVPEVGSVHAVARNWPATDVSDARLQRYALDLTDPAQLAELAQQIQQQTERLHRLCADSTGSGAVAYAARQAPLQLCFLVCPGRFD